MNFFSRDTRSTNVLEDDLEKANLRSQISGKEAEEEEKKSIIKRLKKEYGPNWRKILFGGMPHVSLADLKGVLGGMKEGMIASTKTKDVNPMLNPAPPKMEGTGNITEVARQVPKMNVPGIPGNRNPQV